ncbi:MAG: hypothetical protein U9R42_09460 [Bacteroidota bacterium]|nr:hypothetical protein [Bacteroidota bacterium]
MNNLLAYLLSIIVLLSISFTAKTQDIIYKNDGSKIEAKIVKIAQDVVKYKKYSDIEGATFILEISEITMIRYESGKNVFLTKAFTDVKKEVEEFELENNLITFHLFDIIFDDFTLSYEKISDDGTMGVQIPIAIGFDKNSYYAYSDYSNIFYTGIGLNFYPTGQGIWKYFVGPSIRLGKLRAKDNGWSSDAKEVITFYGKFLINNGIMFSPTPNYSVSAIGSLGIKYFDKEIDDYIPSGIYSAAHFAINISYRFNN